MARNVLWHEMLYDMKRFHTDEMLSWHETLSWYETFLVQGNTFMTRKRFHGKEIPYGMKCFQSKQRKSVDKETHSWQTEKHYHEK